MLIDRPIVAFPAVLCALFLITVVNVVGVGVGKWVNNLGGIGKLMAGRSAHWDELLDLRQARHEPASVRSRSPASGLGDRLSLLRHALLADSFGGALACRMTAAMTKVPFRAEALVALCQLFQFTV